MTLLRTSEAFNVKNICLFAIFHHSAIESAKVAIKFVSKRETNQI